MKFRVQIKLEGLTFELRLKGVSKKCLSHYFLSHYFGH